MSAAEPMVWESTTPGYIRFVSERRYRLFSAKVRRWYRPICPHCGPRKRWPAIDGAMRPNTIRLQHRKG